MNDAALWLTYNSSLEQTPCSAQAKDSFGCQNSWLQKVPRVKENRTPRNHENYKDQKRGLRGPMSP